MDNFFDIPLPILKGGATPSENQEEINELRKQVEENSAGASRYFNKNSFTFILIIICIAALVVLLYTNRYRTDLILSETWKAILFVGIIAFISSCIALLIYGYGSNKAVEDINKAVEEGTLDKEE